VSAVNTIDIKPMIHITLDSERRRPLARAPLFVVAVTLSLALHGALGLSATGLSRSAPPPHDPSQLAFVLSQKPPTTKPKLSEPKPRPEPKPAPKAKPKPKPQRSRRPRPNRQIAPKTPPKIAAKPVFGVTKASTRTGGSGPAVRVGNTLDKQMERRYTRPAWIKPLSVVERRGAAAAPKGPKTKPRAKPVPAYRLTRTPSFRRKVAPRYPAKARREGLAGTVLLEVLVGADGEVRAVKVLRSPSKLLARAAIAALKRSSLLPGRIGSRAVAVRMKIPYRFVLDG
jgi:protein TonB